MTSLKKEFRFLHHVAVMISAGYDGPVGKSSATVSPVDINDESARPLVPRYFRCWVEAGSHGKIEGFEMFDQASPHPILGHAIIEVPALPRKALAVP